MDQGVEDMMESVGFIMLCGGIAGALLCLAALLMTGVIFAKQRKKLLDKLQQE